jgi:hypothetical protein
MLKSDKYWVNLINKLADSLQVEKSFFKDFNFRQWINSNVRNNLEKTDLIFADKFMLENHILIGFSEVNIAFLIEGFLYLQNRYDILGGDVESLGLLEYCKYFLTLSRDLSDSFQKYLDKIEKLKLEIKTPNKDSILNAIDAIPKTENFFLYRWHLDDIAKDIVNKCDLTDAEK